MTPKQWKHAEVFASVDSALLEEIFELRERRLSRLCEKNDASVADLTAALGERAPRRSGGLRLPWLLLAVCLALALLTCAALTVLHFLNTPTDAPQPPVTAHTHVYAKRITAPSCTEGGYTLFVCTDDGCGDSYRANETPATGHTERVIAGKTPTYNESGYTESIVCAVCQAVLTEAVEIDALTHHYEPVRTVPPSCTERGYTVYACTDADCTSGYLDRYTLPTGHTAGVTVRENEKAATCLAEGSYELVTYCASCSEAIGVQAVTTPLSAHTAGAAVKEGETPATCETRAYYDAVSYCTVCHAEASRETVYLGKLAHGAETATRLGGDCTRGDCYTVFSCTLCGDTLYKVPLNVTAKASHAMTDGACAHCGMPESSAGLAFEWIAATNEYTLTGMGSCTDEEVTVGVYNGRTVSAVADECFRESTVLRALVLSDGVRTVGESVAEGCTRLSTLRLGEGVTEVGRFAFHGCTSLGQIFFPESLALCESLFTGCKLSYLSVSPSNPTYLSIDGNLYSKNGETLIRYAPGKHEASFRIPDGVTSVTSLIGASLGSLTISADVTSIGKYAFTPSRIGAIVFEVTEGWYNAMTEEPIDPSILADPESAAALLVNKSTPIYRKTD